MEKEVLLPKLFRTEYRNIVSVLCYLFGIEHIEIAEDIVSDTFLSATEQWSMKEVPENPTAWLYTVAKNKAKNYLKRDKLFQQKLTPQLKYITPQKEEIEIDLSHKSIADSQLAMMFAVCHPSIAPEAQVALALTLLCGFGIQETADAFLTNKEVIYKRIQRAREKLKAENIAIAQPTLTEINERLDMILASLYLLFSEGYYSTSQNVPLRKDLCAEAMRLTALLVDNAATRRPSVYALMALMCYHASRFDARSNANGETILYQDQDETLWDKELIAQGNHFLNQASTGSSLSKYHLEAGIAYWHTLKEDSPEKWEHILELYNILLVLEYSPIAALNRTFALGKARGKEIAIAEAEKLQLTSNPFYYSLLGHLYTEVDNSKALQHFSTAYQYSHTEADKSVISRHIERLKGL